jgi:hypothetical protein
MIDHVMTTMPGAASATVKEKLPNDISSSSPLHIAVRKANEKVPRGKVQPDSETAEISSLSSDGQRSSSLMIQTESKAAPKGISYIDGMREAGYPLDLNNDLNTLDIVEVSWRHARICETNEHIGIGQANSA